jgi:basic membrane lipoprotein Med (substrate-binding protein (PBP1-ABC) superfamily)
MGAGAAALAPAVLPVAARAQGALKVAGIYTVPVEQQWVSRIHLAAQAAIAAGEIEYAFTENVANTDYPRVMREYADQGVQLIVGEIFGVEQEAREVAAEYPETAFLMGSSFMPDAAANPNLAVFDNYIQDASYLTGIIAGSMTQTGNVGMVGGFPIPEVNRLMHAFMAGVRETRADATF